MQPEDEKVDMVLKQVCIERTVAAELLQKTDGDVLEAVLLAHGYTKPKVSAQVTLSDGSTSKEACDRVQSMRDILDEKDVIFTEWEKQDKQQKQEKFLKQQQEQLNKQPTETVTDD